MKSWVPSIVPNILHPLSYFKKLLASLWGEKYGFNFSGEKTEVQKNKVACPESLAELALVLLQGIHRSRDFVQTWVEPYCWSCAQAEICPPFMKPQAQFSRRPTWSLFSPLIAQGSWGFCYSSVGKGSACNAGDPSSIPGSGRSPQEGIGYPLQ